MRRVPPTQQGNKKLKTPQIRVGFLHASSAQLFRPSSKLSRTGFSQNRVSRDGSNSVSTVPSLKSRQASRSFSLGQVSLLVVALHFARKTPSAQYVSFCEWIPFLLIMLTAAEESHHWICCHVEHVSSAFQIFATSSTAVVDPRLHRLQVAQQPTQLLRCWVRSLTVSCLLQWVGTNQVCPSPTTQFHSR